LYFIFKSSEVITQEKQVFNTTSPKSRRPEGKAFDKRKFKDSHKQFIDKVLGSQLPIPILMNLKMTKI